MWNLSRLHLPSRETSRISQVKVSQVDQTRAAVSLRQTQDSSWTFLSISMALITSSQWMIGSREASHSVKIWPCQVPLLIMSKTMALIGLKLSRRLLSAYWSLNLKLSIKMDPWTPTYSTDDMSIAAKITTCFWRQIFPSSWANFAWWMHMELITRISSLKHFTHKT